MTYVPLHVFSLYSVGMGAIRLKHDALANACVAAGMPACAVTDMNSLAGLPEFSASARKTGVQPILGTEMTLRVDGLTGPIVLLASTQAGYQRLVELSSLAAITGTFGAAVLDITQLDNVEGLIALSGGVHGLIDQHLVAGRTDEAQALAITLQQIFTGGFALEITRQGTPAEASREPGLVALAGALGIPLVATNPSYFLTAGEHAAHDALLCNTHKTYLSVDDRVRVPESAWLMGPTEMAALFADLPEAVSNTVLIAQSCSAIFEEQRPQLPRFPGLPEDVSEHEALTELAEIGLGMRLASEPTPIQVSVYEERLAFELGVIASMGFSGYFLIVSDFIQWSKDQDIPVGPGRGSGAGSLVAWVLGITDIDPLQHGLLFERFLNPDRVSMPDFDIDFAQEGRDAVIDYVRTRYQDVSGDTPVEHVAQIATYQKLRARAAVFTAGRVMGLSFPMVNTWTQMVPNDPGHPVSLTEAMGDSPLREALLDADERVHGLFRVALGIEDLYANISTHAAGVVITRGPLATSTPLMRDRNGALITQMSMKGVEAEGHVKFDFLGLKTLDIIQGTLRMVEARGTPLDLQAAGLSDPGTYAAIARGDTFGVFQVESSGMVDSIRMIMPDRFEDLVAIGALYRPGPMANIPEYARVKRTGDAPNLLHPMLEPILRETHGIIVYQEQVMEIARKMAGYTLGQADLLRRAMGKKIPEEMHAQRAIFCTGAEAQGVDTAVANAVFELLFRFADYGFNKSHAAAYAKLTFQTAYLKHHVPAAFFASSMNLLIGKVEDLALYAYQARESGMTLLPPDVNVSQARFSLEDTKGGLGIRYGLCALSGVGTDAMEALVAERTKNGPYRSLKDLTQRVGGSLNKKMLESLTYGGALDGITVSRGDAIQNISGEVKSAEMDRKNAKIGQGSLFDRDVPAAAPVLDLDRHERMERELKTLGFYFGTHPITEVVASRRDTLGLSRALGLPTHQLPHGKVKIPVVLMTKPEFRKTRAGKPMAILTVSDSTRITEMPIFGDLIGIVRHLLVKGEMLLLEARIQVEGESRRIWIDGIQPITKAAKKAA